MSSTTKRLGGMTTTQRNINKLYGTNTRKAVSTQSNILIIHQKLKSSLKNMRKRSSRIEFPLI